MPFWFPISAHTGSTTYTIEGAPVLFAALVCTLCLVVIVFALRRIRPWSSAIAAALGALFFSALISAAWLLLTADPGQNDFFGSHGLWYIERVFFGAMLVEHGAVILAAIALFISFGVMSKERRASVWATLALLLACAAFRIFWYSYELEKLNTLPIGAISGPPQMHIGQTRTITPMLRDSRGWQSSDRDYRLSVTPAEIVGKERGKQSVVVRAVHKDITVETVASVSVVDARSNMMLQLVDGMSMTYEGDEECTYAGGRKTKSHETEGLTMRSLGVRDGIEIFSIEALGHKAFEVYAADGETYWLPGPSDRDEQIQPALVWDQKAGSACILKPLGLKAICSEKPPRIEKFFVYGGTGTAEKVVLGVLTLGLHVPESSSCTLELSYTGPIPYEEWGGALKK